MSEKPTNERMGILEQKVDALADQVRELNKTVNDGFANIQEYRIELATVGQKVETLEKLVYAALLAGVGSFRKMICDLASK
jgi:uncharacterized coiled-coil protein SlyX